MLLALGSIVLLAVVAAIALPFHERIALRRMGLRVMGEVAAAPLRVRDPWAGQHGVEPGGMPDRGFLAAAAPETASAFWAAFRDRRASARVSGFASAETPVRPEFAFEFWDDPGLAELRTTYDLERLITRDLPDFASLAAASDWVARRWHPGSNAPPLAAHFDAREILRRAGAGESFDCGTYAWTLIQVLAALGINGRLVELEAPSGLGHTVVEAWCDDLGKWVLLDPYANATYLVDGVPANALDIHRAWHDGRAAAVRIVTPREAAALRWPGATPRDRLSYYEHFNVRMRNDVRSARYPRWHPRANRIMSALEWNGEDAGRWGFRHAARDSAALYFELKTTALRFAWQRPDTTRPPVLAVRLASCTPNFESFVISQNGGPWEPVGERVEITPRPGTDTVRFAARNRAGRVGRPSWIAIESHAAPRAVQPRPEPALATGGTR